MARTTRMLNAATATGLGAVAVLGESANITVQAWITAGSATVVIKGSNDPLALTDPANAAWDSIATLELAGTNDQAAFRDILPFERLVAEVTAVSGGAVSAVLGVA